MNSTRQYVAVRDVMSDQPAVVDGLATVQEAIDIMRERNISSVIVDRRHPGDEYGMVVIHDIAEQIIGRGRAPERVNVYETMSKPVISVHADMDIRYATRLLSRFGLSRAIVLEHGNLIGIVTLRELVLRSIPAVSTGDA
jgi:predicted transcriptional regulator